MQRFLIFQEVLKYSLVIIKAKHSLSAPIPHDRQLLIATVVEVA